MPQKKTKSWSVQVKESSRKFLSVIIVVVIIAFLLRLKVVAEWVAPMIGTTPAKLQESAGYVYDFSLGALLLLAGWLIPITFFSTGVLLVGAMYLIMVGVRLYNARGDGKDITLF